MSPIISYLLSLALLFGIFIAIYIPLLKIELV